MLDESVDLWAKTGLFAHKPAGPKTSGDTIGGSAILELLI